MYLYAIKQKDDKYDILGNADNFKINQRLKLVLFKRGFKNVAMYKLDEIKSIQKFDCLDQFEMHRKLKGKNWT